MTAPPDLTRRERQIMDIIYRMGRATAAEVRDGLDDEPSYSTVRALLRVLVDKGHLRHQPDGPRYVYIPTVSRERARVGALRQVVQTFFEGSAAQAMAALLDHPGEHLSADELAQLAQRIEQARKEGR
jgi:predicted transcriptional regulator